MPERSLNSTEKKNKAGLHDRLSLFLDLKRSNGDCKMHAGTFGIYRRITFAVLQLGGTVSWYQNFAQAITTPRTYLSNFGG